MKYVFSRIIAMVFAIAFGTAALADAVYPINNPTYIPTAISGPTSYSAAGDHVMTVHGLSTVALQVTGTCTGLTAAPQVSADGTNYVTVPASPAAGGANVTSITSTGLWRVNVSGMKKARLHITVLSAACAVSMTGTPSSAANVAVDTSGNLQVGLAAGSSSIGTVTLGAGTAIAGKFGIDQTTDGTTNKVSVSQLATSGDPCSNPSILKSSVAVNQASSTTAALVDTSASTVVYLCGFTASAVGTNPTFTLVSGTQTTTPCDTGAANLTGTINPSATVGMVNMGSGHTVASTGAGGQLCMTTAATTDVDGVLTYVQQ